MDESLENFFNPKSVAIIGASSNPHKDGYHILKNLVNNFNGDIYPINPNATEIDNLKSYKSVLAVPFDIDLAIIFVNASLVENVLIECIKKGIKNVIIESSGFAEVSKEGKKLQDRIAQLAKENNVRIWGPNCTGIVSSNGLVTTFAYVPEIKKGNISIIAQSGNISGALLIGLSTEYSLGISKVCAIGNRCDINECDLLEYLSEDDETSIILLYLEGFINGRRFLNIVKKIDKPIILLHGGKSSSGVEAAKSHTGSLSGNAKIVEAAIKQANCIMADDFDELFSLCKIIVSYPPMNGNKIAIITPTGGMGVVSSDLADKEGFVLSPATKTLEKLKEYYPSWMPPKNPIDIWPTAEKIGYAKAINLAIDLVSNDNEVDIMVIIFLLSGSRIEEFFNHMYSLDKKLEKPLAVYISGDYNSKTRYRKILGDKGLFVFNDMVCGFKALSKIYKYWNKGNR